jgi:ferric-dicitrate binding protein FerR (iron transport regulator)
MNAVCLKPKELTRRVFEGADRALQEHLDACPACAREAAATRMLADLGRELPDGAPSEESVAAIRHALLASASDGIIGNARARKRYWIPVAAAASIALAVGVVLLAHGPSEPLPQKVATGEARRALVHAQKGADHVLLGSQPDEIVRLTEGTIAVEVEKLGAKERFRVVTGDAEVEVRGTAFDVTAANDVLVGVRVWSGMVEVRPRGREVVLLAPGEQWQVPEGDRDEGVRTVEAAVSQGTPSWERSVRTGVNRDRLANDSSAGAVDPRGTREEAGAGGGGPGSGPPTEPAEAAFNAGWDALRLGRPAEAAKLFGRAADLGRGEAMIEDAVFWRAVALDRAGAHGPAADGMREFLQRFPSSVRRGEVSVMLGWKLLASGDPAGARVLFESALSDPVHWVRASAARGASEAGRGTEEIF